MTSAPVTAPIVSLRDRLVQLAATVIHSSRTDSDQGPAGSDYARAEALVRRYQTEGPAVLEELHGDSENAGFLAAAFAQAERAYLDAMLRLHDWDELIFGGYICLHCTPADAGPDDNVGFPCPPLREAGITNEIAVQIIKAHYEKVEQRAREEAAARAATLPELAGFRDYDGVKVGYVGDQGDIAVLGWHDNPAVVLRAMDRLARDEAGIDGVYDNPEHSPSPEDLSRVWAVNEGNGTGEEQWCLRWMTVPDGGAVVFTASDDPGAFPITVLVA